MALTELVLLILLYILSSMLFWRLGAHNEWSKMRYIRLGKGGALDLKGSFSDGIGIDASECDGDLHFEDCTFIGRQGGTGFKL